MFLQNRLWVPGYPKISNFGYPVPEITDLCIPTQGFHLIINDYPKATLDVKLAKVPITLLKKVFEFQTKHTHIYKKSMATFFP